MGIAYKLLPKIKDFIIEQKKKEPNLSCRKLSSLIFKKFQVSLSKSSVNSLIKQAGLSSSIGRRRKMRRGMLEAEGLGSLLLKATDLLLGGSVVINKAIRERLPKIEDPSMLEGLLYLPLFKVSDSGELPLDSGLWSLIGKKQSYQAIVSYLNEIQGVTTLTSDIFRVISDAFKEVWFVKITLSDNSLLYLDGELRTVWSTPNIPYDFSSTIYKSKSYINKYISENSTLILFTAPGYDIPTKEFLDFLMVQDALEKKMVKITLYGDKMEELETMRLPGYDKRYYVFGLWPWQFEGYRKVKLNNEFRVFYFEPLQQNFYIAEAEIELTQPKINQMVRIRGCVLKSSLSGKIKIIIATNLPGDKVSLEELANLYLSRWPNLEEGFTDFSRKIELFTYTASSRKIFSAENLVLARGEPSNIREVLEYYLRGLDLYLRWHILPSDYEEMDFSTTKERFYNLRARIRLKKDYQLVSFILPKDSKDYSFNKDLVYACHRLNEKEVILSDKKQLWFGIS